MRIAVTYENGNVFQHFGRTESFKIYDVEDGKVVSSEVIGSDGAGHSALANLLSTYDINVLICGGIGSGAQIALSEVGIEICAGAEGDTNEVVEAYLRGELADSGVNCDHHHEEGEGCHCGGQDDEEGCGCGGGCGDSEEGCGGGCGGCCGGAPAFEGPNVGKNVRVHYRGTFNDGTQFDSSYDRGETLDFVCGAGMMIPGFDKAVATMEVGQEIDVHLMPEEAYGPSNPNMIMTFKIAELPGSENLSLGQQVYLSNAYGQPFPVKVVALTLDSITLDANPEMAGKELNFHIQLVEVAD